ncbi:MAG: tyrosine-protein phosphatase [bacterium]
MIDLHCHILPGMDDGAENIKESVTMCHIAYKDGIRTIVATPHTMNGIFINERDYILEEVKKLQDVLISKKIDILIIPGADVHINYNLLELIRDGKAMTINNNGKYILLEFPHHHVPPNISEFVFKLKHNKIIPVFTHPERNIAIQKDLNIIFRLVELGALAQITANSLIGEFGPGASKCAVEMLQNNLVHIIASDAHSSKFRTPVLSDSVVRAARIAGPKWAEAMVTDIPRAIIAGEDIYDLPAPITTKKSLFKKIFK